MEFLITLILIIIIVFWLLFRFLPRLLVWYLQRKMGGNKFYKGNPNYNEKHRSNGKEGDVTVTTFQEQEKIITKEVGEYVDFEEEKDQNQ